MYLRKKTRNPILKERCPICHKYDYVGDQGYGRFFCSTCCVEFKKTVCSNGFTKVEIFVVDEDGKQSMIDDYVEKDGIEYSISDYKKLILYSETKK